MYLVKLKGYQTIECFIQGTCSENQRDVYLQCFDLAPGDYLLFTEVDWPQGEKNSNKENHCTTKKMTRESFHASCSTELNEHTAANKTNARRNRRRANPHTHPARRK